MSGDYKYDIQQLAEEMAEEELGRDFYALSSSQQIELYRKAEQEYWDRAYAQAS